ncbi:MAG: hypothetical protein LBR26_07115 [Prevotella sp.]|jgi:type I restriction enzyme R subunit|nr:hypothetical protein [Prevotella sp.]
MKEYNLVAENSESTVVSEYKTGYKRAVAYQSKAALERAFIEQLQTQAYEYPPIKPEQDLIANLRTQLEQLNDIHFSDSEWEQFFAIKIANPKWRRGKNNYHPGRPYS